jgi:hypothetical protein
MISPSNRRSVFAYHVVLCTATHLPVRPGRSASHQLMQRILRKNRCEVEKESETKQRRKTYLYRDVCTWKSKCKKKYALHNIVYTDVAVDLFNAASFCGCCRDPLTWGGLAYAILQWDGERFIGTWAKTGEMPICSVNLDLRVWKKL